MPPIYVTHSLPWLMILTGNERLPIYYPGKLRCPECGGPLTVNVTEWETVTGRPTECGVEVSCVWWEMSELEEEAGGPEAIHHRWWQSDWQPVVDQVGSWGQKHLRRV